MDLTSVAFVDSYALAFNVADLCTKDKLFGIISLCVYPYNSTLFHFTVLNLNMPFLMTHTIYRPTLKVQKPTRTHHHFWIHKHTASSLDEIITHKFTVYEVYDSLLHWDEARDFLSNLKNKNGWIKNVLFTCLGRDLKDNKQFLIISPPLLTNMIVFISEAMLNSATALTFAFLCMI